MVALDGKEVQVHVKQISQHLWECTYTASVPGEYLLSVFYGDEQIQRSPFKVGAKLIQCFNLLLSTVLTYPTRFYWRSCCFYTFLFSHIPNKVAVSRQRQSKIKAFGPGLHRGVVGMPNIFTVVCNNEAGGLGKSSSYHIDFFCVA
ncbi:unnamed protein product [Protopolystoma xenopodis]|uniref:Uncharacterized protein n=1 Tax=Protopolystoma xenopodis TaxID=117903 RepID=A0A448WEV0_9PLAT|nr:unnamed protein product [Protopolystoma xenopodis]